MFRFILCLLVMTLPVTLLGAESPLETLRPYLKQHCYACHGAKKQENDKRFDSLGTDLSKVETIVPCNF